MIALPVLSPVQSRLPTVSAHAESSHADSAALMIDNHGRPITYVRLAVTDKCNLRCTYCMPETMKFASERELMTLDEMLRVMNVLASLGIRKVRITGGEPFVRKGLMELLWRLRELSGIDEVHITTNGILTAPHVPQLAALGINAVNLSLDTLDHERFKAITRRDGLEAVLATFHALVAHNVPTKLNAVVMDGINIDDIVPLARLTKEYPVEVRFIEDMPFDGASTTTSRANAQDVRRLRWNYQAIVEHLRSAFPAMQQTESDVHATSVNYAIAGHRGTVGVIAGFSRTFCGACNRLRITAKGILKTCLYDAGVADLKGLLRQGASDDDLRQTLLDSVAHRFKDGFEAEEHARKYAPTLDSMSVIGG